MKTFFQRYFFLLDSQAKKQLPLLLLIFISSSFLDIIGIGLVGAFLLLIVNFSSMLQKLPLSLQYFLNQFNQNHVIFTIGIGLVFAFILKGFWGIYSQKRIVLFSSQFAVRLKMRLMAGFQNADYAFHLQQNSAYLMNKISQVDNFSNNVLLASLNMLSSLFIVCSVIACLVSLHPLVTFFLAAMIGLLFLCYEIFVKNDIVRMGKELATSAGEINKFILQAMGGLKEIRVLGKENYFRNKLNNVISGYAQALATFNSLQLIPRYAVESAASIFLVGLVLGALVIGTSPVNMIPTLGIFATACIRLLPTISQLISQFSQIRSGAFTTQLIYEEINLLENTYKKNLEAISSSLIFKSFSLDRVLFRYPNAKQDALDNINLTLHRGQSIGFMGASGAGKSTLVSIFLGLLSPDAGQLLVDGFTINNLREWLNNFAYIPQAIFLLDDTLKRNIALGTEDCDIDNQKLQEAIAMAQLSEVVSELPNGADTLIGENGVRLSGGQRQRVALARALYYEREIIIMDEATSALDNETEREVINSIKKLHGVKTLIVVAHRLTTLQYCDVVYKLEKGRIIAQGSFDDVVRKQEVVDVH
ncbi:MAG: ABC transporter ATP-binding protein [Coxiellaceae bacterium]|nr:ABC transporter ATP-binding protein [Coxiellaceae bacterium]